MRVQSSHAEFEIRPRSRDGAALDLVVPYTTPVLTQAALDAANRLAGDLDARIRLIKVQTVPFPADLRQSPVRLRFLRKQLTSLRSALPVAGEIRLARESLAGLTGALKPGTIVVLACRKRLWRTREEKLAARLRGFGSQTILIETGNPNA